MQTIYGIKSAPGQSESDAAVLGINLVRITYSITTGLGLQQMQAGFRYSVNIKEIPTGSLAISNSKMALRLDLTKAPFLPFQLVVGNEEDRMNVNVSDYVAWFSAVWEVGQNLGIQVVNGGITRTAANQLAEYSMLQQGLKTSAKTFRDRNVLAGKAAQTWCLTEMDLFKAKGYSFPYNFHYQIGTQQNVSDYTSVIEQLQILWQGQVECNECGQPNNDVEVTKAILTASSPLYLHIWYNFTGSAGYDVAMNQPQREAYKSIVG